MYRNHIVSFKADKFFSSFFSSCLSHSLNMYELRGFFYINTSICVKLNGLLLKFHKDLKDFLYFYLFSYRQNKV